MTSQKTLSAQSWVELGLLGLFWGASFLSVRVALDEIGVLTSVLHRVGWAMLVLWAVVALLRLPVPRDPRFWGAFLVMGALNNVIPFGLMAWGQLYIETGLTSIFNAATAIFGVVVAALVFADERLTPARMIGTILGFLGVAVAIGLSALTSFDIRSTAQLAVIAGTLSYACAGAWARIWLSGLNPVVAAAGMLTGSTVLMVPLTLWIEGVPTLDLLPRTWMAIGYYTLIATAGAYLLYYRVLARAGSGNLMLVTLLVPPVAITLGAVVLGEALAPRAFLGFGLLAVGLLVLNGTLPLPRALRRD